ncbi:hypothetical protein [Halovivax cerinus]|uniref:Uncharacterized protein n=1 Tax=Halovivax cerinus TaxID=1487865 RepID=A0ABD5NTG0_9EURY|nr:hypothetical protein [Halovivax cerinus]
MKRIFCVLALVAVAIAMAMGSAAGDVAAQTDGNVTTVDDDPRLDDVPDDAVSFDDATHVTSWRFEDGRAHLTITTDISRDVTISDALAGAGVAGATRVPQREYEVPRGTHRVSVPVETVRGANAVSVSTDSGTVRLSTAMESDDAEDPFSYFGGGSGVLSGVALSILMSGGAAGWVLWREETGVIRA